VAQKGSAGIFRVHAASVIGDSQEGHAAVTDLHSDLGGTGIYGIFQQLFDNACRTLDHLAGGY
jgi:hypothetical protein